MKDYSNCLRVIPIFFLFLLLSFSAGSQIRPGIKFGLSTPDISPRDFIVSDKGIDYYHIFVQNARYGVHVGAFLQMQLGGFFIQPEVLYNSSSIDYRLDSLFNGGLNHHILRDSYRSVDFPIMLGLKTGPVRLGGGPVAHAFVGRNGGFSEYDSFHPLPNTLTWGWQAGIGLDLWKLHFDARYEGNFSKLGDYISFFGQKFDFDTRNNRLIGSVGFSF